MDTIAGSCAFTADNDIPAGVFFAIARRAKGADQLRFKPMPGHAAIKIVTNIAIAVARRVQRGYPYEILCQRNEVITAGINSMAQGCRVLHVFNVGTGAPVGKHNRIAILRFVAL
jgi:hypothetical protein